MRKRSYIRIAVDFMICIGILLFVQRLLMPKYMHGNVEGAMTAEYYKDPSGHNVIFVGDCELYENFSTVTLWKEYGINSYIRGNAQQLIWQSYYLMEDTLRYEKPEVIVFNVLSLKYDSPEKEEYNRMTLDGMRWSRSKVNAIKASMVEGEHFIEYIFPILRFHSRWQELEGDDFRYLISRDKVTHNGYYMRVDVKPVDKLPAVKQLGDYSFGDNAWYYLDKILELCRENDIQLILVKAPSLIPYWYDEWDLQVEEYAERNGLPYYNFLRNIEDIGIDYTTDTYDAGLHLNISGAEKLSKYFGSILSNDYAVTDLRNDERLSNIWDEKISAYEEDIINQERLTK